MRKRPPSNHSKVTLPGTTPSNSGWVASVDQVPISASKGSSMGLLTGPLSGSPARHLTGRDGLDPRDKPADETARWGAPVGGIVRRCRAHERLLEPDAAPSLPRGGRLLAWLERLLEERSAAKPTLI